jgi:hypothetical protein
MAPAYATRRFRGIARAYPPLAFPSNNDIHQWVTLFSFLPEVIENLAGNHAS